MSKVLLAAPAAALVLLSAACAHPFHAGAAAVVGKDRVSTQSLRDMVSRGVAGIPTGATQKPETTTIERNDLTELIQLVVLRKLAGQYNVTVNAQDIDAALTQAAQQQSAQAGASTDAATALKGLQQAAAASGIDPETLRTYAEVAAYEQKIVAAIPVDQAALQAAYDKAKASYVQVHVAHILVATQAQAESILAQVQADPTKFAALAKQFSTDPGSKNNGGDLGFAAPSAYVAEFAAAVTAGKDGTIVGPVKTQFGYHVIKIIEHRTTSLAAATPQLTSSINAPIFVAKYGDLVKATSISVNPRYGTWNAKGGQDGFGVVEASNTGDLSSPISPGASGSSSPAPVATTPATGG